MKALTRYQLDALIKIYEYSKDPNCYPGVQLREPTKYALIKRCLAFRVNLPNGITNGWALRLTDEGKRYAEEAIELRKLPPVYDDPYEGQDCYDPYYDQD